MDKQKELENIYNNYVNGNRKNMVEQIDEYGTYDFFEDFVSFLLDFVSDNWEKTFVDVVITYHKIKG